MAYLQAGKAGSHIVVMFLSTCSHSLSPRPLENRGTYSPTSGSFFLGQYFTVIKHTAVMSERRERDGEEKEGTDEQKEKMERKGKEEVDREEIYGIFERHCSIVCKSAIPSRQNNFSCAARMFCLF